MKVKYTVENTNQDLPFSDAKLLAYLRKRHPDAAVLCGRELLTIRSHRTKWCTKIINCAVKTKIGDRRAIPLIFKSLDFNPGANGLQNFLHQEALTLPQILKEKLIAAPYLYDSRHCAGPGVRWLLMEFVEGRDPMEYWWVGDSLIGEARDAVCAVPEHARLHARTWGEEARLARDYPWLFYFSYDREMSAFEEIFVCLHGLGKNGLYPDFVKRWSGTLPLYMETFSRAFLAMNECPRVLNHGDPRGSYIIKDGAPGKPPEVVYFDFEKCQIAPACMDFDLLYKPTEEINLESVALYRRTLLEERNIRISDSDMARWLELGKYPPLLSQVISRVLRHVWSYTEDAELGRHYLQYVDQELGNLCQYAKMLKL